MWSRQSDLNRRNLIGNQGSWASGQWRQACGGCVRRDPLWAVGARRPVPVRCSRASVRSRERSPFAMTGGRVGVERGDRPGGPEGRSSCRAGSRTLGGLRCRSPVGFAPAPWWSPPDSNRDTPRFHSGALPKLRQETVLPCREVTNPPHGLHAGRVTGLPRSAGFPGVSPGCNGRHWPGVTRPSGQFVIPRRELVSSAGSTCPSGGTLQLVSEASFLWLQVSGHRRGGRSV